MAHAAATYDPLFILSNLVSKDFKVRYRNMSLGIFWSLVNPLIMMAVLTFVFTNVFPTQRRFFPLFVLMGLLPYNFFALAWATGTNSIVDSGPLIKKLAFQRELVPISVVLANALHYLIQLGLLLLVCGVFIGFNSHWIWMPVLVLLQVAFACGAALLSSALDVYFRDMRYIVESSNLILFWMVPIFYGFEDVQDYAWIYQYNPIAAVVLLTRKVLLEGQSPWGQTLWLMTGVTAAMLVAGFVVFKRAKRGFSDYL